MSRRLAPTLSEDVKRRHMTESGKACRVGDCGRCHRGAAELRALLAVVTAAERMRLHQKPVEWSAAKFWANPQINTAGVRHVETLHRALARLRKVSGRKP